MGDTITLKSCSRGHLGGLLDEISTLIGHARPDTKSSFPTTCWSTNSTDVDVALTVIWASGSSIHDGVTRFNLVFKASPGEAASESMATEMGGFCQRMVSSLTLLSSVGASEAMVGYFSTGVRAVLHSLKDFVQAFLESSRHSQLNSLTGTVWQACKELQQAPKTNKLACRRQMMQWSVAIKDTIDEFQEAAKTAAAANVGTFGTPEAGQSTSGLDEQFGGLSVGGEKEEMEDDFNFDDMDEDYSPSELQCVEATIDILRVFRRCLKAANDSLNTLDSPEAQGKDDVAVESKGEGWLKAKLEWAHTVQVCLDEANECAGEVGVLLYPPLDGSELSGRADDLERTLIAFCDTFYTSGGGGNEASVGGGQPPLRALLEEKLGVLRAGLVQL